LSRPSTPDFPFEEPDTDPCPCDLNGDKFASELALGWTSSFSCCFRLGTPEEDPRLDDDDVFKFDIDVDELAKAM